MNNHDDWKVAMAYVPWQTFKEPYEPAKALVIGTIFPELDKKFTGKREDALEYYNQCREVLKMAKSRYEAKYGAFSLCNVSKLSEWNWNEGPYPWDNSEGGMR